MAYKIKTKTEVPVEKFADFLTRSILGDLECFEEMPNDDLVKISGRFSEIFEYVNSINDQIKEAEREEGIGYQEYERSTGHEMGVCSGRV